MPAVARSRTPTARESRTGTPLPSAAPLRILHRHSSLQNILRPITNATQSRYSRPRETRRYCRQPAFLKRMTVPERDVVSCVEIWPLVTVAPVTRVDSRKLRMASPPSSYAFLRAARITLPHEVSQLPCADTWPISL